MVAGRVAAVALSWARARAGYTAVETATGAAQQLGAPATQSGAGPRPAKRGSVVGRIHGVECVRQCPPFAANVSREFRRVSKRHLSRPLGPTAGCPRGLKC